MSATLKLYVSWPGELAAGIRSGSETVTITLEYSADNPFEPEHVEALRQTVSEMFDGATVLTQAEQDKADAEDRARELNSLRDTFLYRPMLRPVSFCTIPKGVKWSYAEAPSNQTIIAHRMKIPVSNYLFGIIETDRELTTDECDQYGMKRL